MLRVCRADRNKHHVRDLLEKRLVSERCLSSSLIWFSAWLPSEVALDLKRSLFKET